MCMHDTQCQQQAERVRMNLSQSAKGFFQIDVTVESDSVGRSQEMLKQAMVAVREVMADCNLREAQA